MARVSQIRAQRKAKEDADKKEADKARHQELYNNELEVKENLRRMKTTKTIAKAVSKEPLPVDDNLEDLLTSGCKRTEYVCNRRLLVVYKGAVDETEYTVWLTKISADKHVDIKSLVFVHTAEETYILAYWDSIFRSICKKILDYEGVHPLLRYISNPHQLNRVEVFMKNLVVVPVAVVTVTVPVAAPVAVL